MDSSITLLELQQRITRLVTSPSTREVWVTAELMDVAVRGGHCYMDLVEKDRSGSNTLARARGIIWAGQYSRLSTAFLSATGQRFTSGLKLMVKVTANYHPVFGLSLVISDIDPSYTMGDLLRRRREIIERLRREGILNQNRSIEWPRVANRIAVISAPGAAGYGDFINQLLTNPRRLRFQTGLFQALMQGVKTPSTILQALERIALEADKWDCVVIIRGGGATSDLASFEDYDLAAAIAMFPLPVIIGIGHERDITLLDYVANMRVKTPTAAAEWLIARGNANLDNLRAIGLDIAATARDINSGYMQRLAYCSGLLPIAGPSAVKNAAERLRGITSGLSGLKSLTTAARTRLDALANAMTTAATTQLQQRRQRLDSLAGMLDALSPEATLRRGYSITRVNGHAVTGPSTLRQGDIITTQLADGTVQSTVTATGSN